MNTSDPFVNQDLPGEIQPVEAPPQLMRVRLPNVQPIVTYTIMGLTILVYLLQLATQYLYRMDYPFILGAKVNELIAVGQVWRLFTPMLLHGSILHIGFNMYALFIFGTQLERFYGHGRYLLMYLVAGFAGNVLSYAFSPAISLGASTAIFGLLGAEGVFLYRNWKIFGESAKRSLQNLVILAVVNLLIGLGAQFDNWGHLGGLIGGVAFAWLAGPVLTVKADMDGLRLEDDHGPKETLLSTIIVGAVFAILALAVTLYRG